MVSENRIIEGNIWKGVLALFIPIVISSFFQHMYSIADGIIVGKFLGTMAFSAVGGSAAKIITMLINFFVGVSAGITAYTARYYGQGDLYGVKKVVLNGMGCFIIFRIPLLELFVEEQEVIEIGARLFFVIMPMYLLGIPQTMLIKALQGMGTSFIPMLLTMVGVIGVRVLWVLVVLPMHSNIYFLGACYPISAFIMSVVFIIYYRRTLNNNSAMAPFVH